jgi:2-isopropylmalate synthase
VEWSAEDATRTEHDFLCRAVETAIHAGATTVNIPDTVGYTIPDEYFEIIKMLMMRVPNIDKAVISTHCHNDLGLAVANSIAGVEAGARQVECTINGIGERAGNASMEEIVMTFRTRHDRLPFTTNIDAKKIMPASKLLTSITGFSVQPNKAIVGANAFAHESGIHQDGMLKHANTYEIMTPESVGRDKSDLVLGKHSGRNAFRTKLVELGFDFKDDDLNAAFDRFKELADRQKKISDDDLIRIAKSKGGASSVRS